MKISLSITFSSLLVGCLLGLQSAQATGLSLEQQRKLFADAERALQQRNFAGVAAILPQLDDYLLYPYLRYKYLLGNSKKSVEVAEFIQQYPDTPYAPALRKNILKAYAAGQRWQDFIGLYAETDDAQLQCQYYHALSQNGQNEIALQGARALWLVGNSQPKACDALFDGFKKSADFAPQLIWQRFALAMRNNNLSLSRYLSKSMPKAMAQRANFWINVHNSPQQHLSDWQSWPSNDSEYAQIFVHGLRRLAKRQVDLAQNIWTAGAAHFATDSSQSAELVRNLAMRKVYDHRADALAALFALSSDQDDETTRAWRVRIALQQGNWQQVKLALGRLTPEEQATAQWMYWQARALTEVGEAQAAKALYATVAQERDFYGFLASDYLKQKHAFNNRPIDVNTTSAEQLAAAWSFRAMKELMAVNHELDARRLWWYTSQRLQQSELLAAAKLAEQWGWHDVAIFTAARAKYWDDVELRFPLAYKEEVLRHAQAANLEPALVYGVIRRESAFRPGVSSSSGARGLMQIMPKTGKMLARKLKDRWRSAAQLYQPETNLRYGTTYLKQLSDRFQNNLAMVAAAYNAGPHRVERWRPDTTQLAADIWVETIPFTETRRYVKAVLAYMSIYDHRLGGDGVQLDSVISDIQPAKLKAAVIEAQDRSG